MKFNVVCFGSAFVDVYLKSPGFKTVKSSRIKGKTAMCQSLGGKVEIEAMDITTGGGATNTAVSFERKGIQSAVICCVGSDHWAGFIKKDLNNEGVSLVHLQTTKIAKTSYSTILVNQQGQRTALVYRGASNRLDWRKVRWSSLNTDWFYVSSLGGDLALLTKIIRTAQDKGFKVAINPGSGEIKARQKLIPFLKHIDLLIVNNSEASRLTENNPEEADNNLKQLKQMGPRIVAITDGRRGTHIAWDKKIYKTDIFKVNTIEETGAGDAFASGFLSGLILKLKPEETIKLALANSASVVTSMGAKAGLLWQDEIGQWLKKDVSIKRK